MSFVERFEYDLFISYAHDDNAPDSAGCQWVSAFVTHLERALRQRLGGPKSLAIFFDCHNLHAGCQLDSLLEAARSSAVFVAIASRSYANRDWTRDELEAFTASARDLKRLFAVEYLPLDGNDAYPPPLDRHYRQPFFRGNRLNSSITMPITPKSDADGFYDLVHDLAEKIRQQLICLKHGTAGPSEADKFVPPARDASVSDAARRSAREVGFPPDPRIRRVLLAQVTDDLEDQRDQVRRYLTQYNVEVLPDDAYPQGGAEFMQALTADLVRADLFVQLLGPSAGRRPRDLPQGYARFQSDAAVQRGVTILQWRRPDLDLEGIDNPEHKSLLSGQTVIATGLESFKEQVLRQTRRPDEIRLDTPAGLIFIDADQRDLEAVKAIEGEFRRYRLETARPVYKGPSKAVREDRQKLLIECAALLLVYGDTEQVWVRARVLDYNKIRPKRTAPAKVVAIVAGPPEKRDVLDDLGISIAGLREINCGSTWDMARLRPLIDEMRG